MRRRGTVAAGVGLDEFLASGLIALSYGIALLVHGYGFLAGRIVWMYTSRDVYRMLVHDGGWAPDRYQQWLSRTLVGSPDDARAGKSMRLRYAGPARPDERHS